MVRRRALGRSRVPRGDVGARPNQHANDFLQYLGLEDLDPEAMKRFAEEKGPGVEDVVAEAIKRFVEQEGLVSFRKTGSSHCAASAFIDDGGNQLWSVNIVVGDEDQKYIDSSVPIFPYSKVGEPNTMFNSVPIKAAHRASA
jgi:hypothetical protein